MPSYVQEAAEGETPIATVKEEFNRLKVLVAKAMATGNSSALNEKIHITWHDQERERKRTNPNRSTRVTLNCRTPEQWKEFQIEKDRYFEIGIDPHVSLDLMIRALRAFSDSVLADWVKQGFGAGPGPEKAEIPDIPEWMR